MKTELWRLVRCIAICLRERESFIVILAAMIAILDFSLNYLLPVRLLINYYS